MLMTHSPSLLTAPGTVRSSWNRAVKAVSATTLIFFCRIWARPLPNFLWKRKIKSAIAGRRWRDSPKVSGKRYFERIGRSVEKGKRIRQWLNQCLLLPFVVSQSEYDGNHFSHIYTGFPISQTLLPAAAESLYPHSVVHEEMPLLRFQFPRNP